MIYGRDNPTNEQVSSDLNIHVNFKIKLDVAVIFEFLSVPHPEQPSLLTLKLVSIKVSETQKYSIML